MASFTEHYNLKKPGYDDFGDIADINGNFDIIDTALQDAITAVENKIIGKSLAGQSVQPTYDTTVTAGEGAEIFNDTRPRLYGNLPPSTKQGNVASGKYSHAEGYKTTASGDISHAEGRSTKASGDISHAEGSGTKASEMYSHAEGYVTTASGVSSHAEGTNTTASGFYSHAGGCHTIADDIQFVTGKYNLAKDGCKGSNTIVADENSQSANHTIFIIGNGTETTASNAFRITADGQCRGSKAFVGSGADFAEYFEWLDGNSNNEDRRGKFVTLDGEKIKLANDGDYILGVVSASGAFIGNSQSENWQGKYLKDVYGDWLTQEVTVPESTDETGEVIPEHTSIQYVVNPDFDPETEYVSREFRKEWAPVGMLGQLTLVDDGTCIVNGYCKPSANGIGTAADSGYRVLKRLDSTHVKVLVR